MMKNCWMKKNDKSVERSHNPNHWSCIPGYPYKILIIAGSVSGKTNVSLTWPKHLWPDIDNLISKATHYFIMKAPNKRELQEIVPNHSFDMDLKDFMKLRLH